MSTAGLDRLPVLEIQNSRQTRVSPSVATCKLLAALMASGTALLLAGCGANIADTAAPEAKVAVNIAGHVHGGVFPIEAATIRLMVTTSSGYGGAAASLATTTSDQNGYFTFTYPSGGFACPTGQYAYITVTGGYSVNLGSSQNNNDVIQVGAIGPCSDLSASSVANVNVFVSELSTVAAAYALGNFITVDDTNAASGQQIVNISAPANNNNATPGCTGTGSSMTCTANGLGHAFTNAITLVDSVRYDGSFPTGQARQYNPNQPYYSAVPQQLINSIGNILQSCVDSVQGSSCGPLFNYTTAPSSSTDTNCTGGTVPTNTLEAALNMARYPTCQISNRFTLQPKNAFFTPDLDSAPTSFTVSIFYGVGYGGDATPYPVDVALDAGDNAYILYGGNSGGTSDYGAIYGLSPSGTLLFTPRGNGSIMYPTQIAVDTSSHIYVTNNDPSTASNGGVYIATSKAGTLSEVAALNNASGVAVDQSNNLWVSAANTSSNAVSEFTQSAMTSATSSSLASATFSSSATTYAITGLAVDANQGIWGVSAGASGSSNSAAFLLPNTAPAKATPAYGTSGSAGSTAALSAAGGFGVALNASGTAYFALAGKLNTATYAGGTLTASSTTVTTSSSNAPQRLTVDGVGNVFWTDREASGFLYDYNPATGVLISFLPCYPYPDSGGGSACLTTSSTSGSTYTPSNLRSMAIDSAGDVWYVADAGYGAIIETLGLAQPAWPQLSYGHPGVKPQ